MGKKETLTEHRNKKFNCVHQEVQQYKAIRRK